MIALTPRQVHEVPATRDDLKARCSELAKDRKVVRLVDERARTAFVSVLEVAEGLGDVPPEEVALYTVSEHVYRPPTTGPYDDGPVGDDDLALRAFKDNADPSGWLRGMPNSGICMMSISGGFQGPNLHLVGGGASVGLVAALASTALAQGVASVAVIAASSTMPHGGSDARAIVVGAGPAHLPNPLAWPELAACNAYDGLGLLHDALLRQPTETA